MPDSAHRVRLEGVDFAAAFPTLRLFESFRMALQPTKLLLGVFMLLLIYFGGVGLDFVWGVQDPSGTGESFYEPVESYRVFDYAINRELVEFRHLIYAATHFDLGLGTLTGGLKQGVLGSLWAMVIETPAWLWSNHPWFFLIFGAYGLIVKMVLGGAIARLATMQACADASDGLFETMSFTLPRAVWFIVAPIIPMAVAGIVYLILAVGGWVLFNIPGLNIVGALGFFLMLLGGFVAACLLVFTSLGAGLLPSALAVEGTDAFDAVSRVFTFLIYRPVRYLILMAITLIYGALTYLLVGLILHFTLWFTFMAVGAWVGEFDQLVEFKRFGELPVAVETDGLSTMQKGTAWLLLVWSRLWFGLSLAYAISYLFTAQTWMYLLLRRDVDGTDFADCFVESAAPHAGVAAAVSGNANDKLEPTAAGDPDETVEDAAS